VSTEPASGKRRNDRDLVVSVLSGFMAALALAVSTYNVYLQHQQVRAQVWPRLLFRPSFNPEGFTWDLTNGGIGPAEIRTLRLLVDGKPTTDWHDAIQRLTGKELKDFGYSTMRGSLLTAGQSRRALFVADQAIGSTLFQQQQRVSAEICYCSALGDCWVLASNEPQAVAKCPDWAEAAFGD
jgi:hypothetical protein